MKIHLHTIIRVGSALLLAGALAGCSSFLAPTPVGDPFGLNNAEVATLNLSYVGAEAEANVLEGSLPPFVIERPGTVPGLHSDIHTSQSDWLWDYLQANPGFADQLPRHVVVPAPRPSMDIDALLRLLGIYMSPTQTSPPTSLPDTAPPPNAAMLRLIQEQKRQQQQRQDEQRQRILDEHAARMRRMLEQSLQHMHAAAEPNLNLPLPFHLEGGSLGIDLPSLAKLLVNGFRQEISVAELRLSVPEDVPQESIAWPDTLSVESISVAVNAVRRAGNADPQPLLRYDRTVTLEADSGIVFNHAGDGIYLPQDPDAVHLTLSLDQRDARAVFDAINNHDDITGSVDLALLVSPALTQHVGLNFTIRAGEAVIRH